MKAIEGEDSVQGKTAFVSWIVRIAAAIILGQTLFFKFLGAEESVYIFETVGAEPWGRIGSGIVELIAVVLLLVPRLAWMGAGIGLAVLFGAIGSHLTVLGIEVQGDGGTLFALAVAAASCCVATLYLHRGDWLRLVQTQKASELRP